jgi:hypothetical protein
MKFPGSLLRQPSSPNLKKNKMKTKFYTLIALLAITFAGIFTAKGQTTVTNTVLMGKGYVNEVYYSMSAGEMGNVNRSLWDVAFRANRRSASILTNDGSAVELYTYPKSDTNGWATVDTSGIKNWKKMVNSTTDWETGAFCQNQKAYPDYGWGIYNGFTHNVVGDSLFVIKLRDGSLRKLWIMEKYSTDNIFEFRFAKLDNTGENTIQLDCNPYATKNFVGYSLATNVIIDFEPVPAANWDILFTKYVYTYPDGTQYPVTGVLSNYKVKVKEFELVAPDFLMLEAQVMDSTRSPIGWDWKPFSNETFTYTVTNTTAYFIQDRAGKIYKLVFTNFDGSSTGRIVFETGMNSFTGVNEVVKSGFNATVYPNPVRDVMNLVINPGKATFALVSVINISGHIVLSQRFDMQSEELASLQLPVSELPSGIYMVKIQSGGNVIARKVVVNN